MKLLLFVFGLTPFLLGRATSWYINANPNDPPPHSTIALLFLLFWAGISFLLKGKRRKIKEVLAFLHIAAAFDLLLLGLQELVFHAYWINSVGVWSQLYYLPVLGAGLWLTNGSGHLFMEYTCSFLCMVGASFVGCKIREMINTQRNAFDLK